MKFSFTKAEIIAAPVGVHYDTKQRGLCVTVTPANRKYGIYVSVRGNPIRKTLGDVNGRSVESVRAEAAKLIATLRETPKQKQTRLTVGDLLTMYNEYLEVQGARDSMYMDRVFRLHWSSLLSRPLADVTVVEVTTQHNKIAKLSGPSAARYAVTCLRTLYNYANSLDLTSANPAKRVRIAAATSRGVYLDEVGVKVMRECLKEMAPNPRAYLLMVLLTGARRSNVAAMEWAEIDLDGALWVVPAEKSKNGLEMEVPLVPEAVELLRGRRALDAKYVFPSTSKIGQPVSNVYEWVLDLRRRLRERGVDVPLTIHDLRRTFTVRLIASGASLPIAAKALGHKGLSSVATYARVSTSTVREALARVGTV